MKDRDRQLVNEFKSLLKKVKKMAIAGNHNIGAIAEDKYNISYTFGGKFLCTFDKKKCSLNDFLINFNPNPDKLTDSEFLKTIKNNKTAIFNLHVSKGRYITNDLDNFVYGLYKSQMFLKCWHWSDVLDKRFGGKPGFAGRKHKYSGLKTKVVKMPIILVDDLKEIAKFLAANHGNYDLSMLNKLLIKNQKK